MYNLDLLTNDAKFLLASMYKEYIVRRKNKVAKIKAVDFWDIAKIKKNIMKDWSAIDIRSTCQELKKHGFITGSNYGDENMISIKITTEAIAVMEARFKDKVNDVLAYVAKVKSLIPFI